MIGLVCVLSCPWFEIVLQIQGALNLVLNNHNTCKAFSQMSGTLS